MYVVGNSVLKENKSITLRLYLADLHHQITQTEARKTKLGPPLL